MKNTIRKQKETGITLIALIITIIVLLILAGITIGMLTSNNSILKQAGSTRNETRQAEEVERVQLAIIDAVGKAVKTTSGELTTDLVKNAIKGQFGEDAVTKVTGEGPWEYEGEYKIYQIDKTGEIKEPNATIAKDSNNVEYYLPRDAKYKEGTVDTGLVITYKGSEFVWIPIEKDTLYAKGTTKKMAKESTGTYAGQDDKGRTKYESVLYDDSLNERLDYGQVTTNYREPSDLQNTSFGDWSTTANKGFDLIIRHIDEYKGLDKSSTEDQATIKNNWVKQLQEEYDAMIESVKKYGGFYVGRYETSEAISSVANVTPISAGTEIEGYAQTWYGLYQRQKKFTSSSDSMVSSMIWGSQYDAMINWAKASGTETGAHVTQTGYGNHTGSVKNTGETTTDVINNIYDLEGNLWEWTLEAYFTNGRVRRGGSYLYIPAPANHDDLYPYDTSAGNGSRLTLYIK